MSDATFTHDVFISHSAKHKAVVRPLAERLQVAVRKHLKVWFDEWEIPVAASRQSAATSAGKQETSEEKDGGALPSRRYAEKIEEGLEPSHFGFRISNFGFAKPGISANAFGSDWAQLEAGTFRFRDPVNKKRNFVPLRLGIK